jgi:hypothetical protein
MNGPLMRVLLAWAVLAGVEAGGHPSNPELSFWWFKLGAALMVAIILGMHLMWMYQTREVEAATAQTMQERIGMADKRELDQARSRLFQAAREGTVRVIIRAIELGAEVDSVDATGKTALYIASQQGQLEAVKTLLEKGADSNLRNKSGVSPLLAATTSMSMNPRCRACALALIKACADASLADMVGDTALIEAVRHDDAADVVTALMNAGADADSVNIRGESARSIIGGGSMKTLLEPNPAQQQAIKDESSVVRSRSTQKKRAKAST